MKVDTFKRAENWYRRRGYLFGKAEGFISSKSVIKRDLFGILDALAVKRGETIGVQVCSQDPANISRHRKKMREKMAMIELVDGPTNLSVLEWLKESGWKIHLFRSGWSDKTCRFEDIIEEL